jgi:hypothetical protein
VRKPKDASVSSRTHFWAAFLGQKGLSIVAWAVLTHNLWVLARLPQAGQPAKEPPLAEAA